MGVDHSPVFEVHHRLEGQRAGHAGDRVDGKFADMLAAGDLLQRALPLVGPDGEWVALSPGYQPGRTVGVEFDGKPLKAHTYVAK